jgi:hypothetical protein
MSLGTDVMLLFASSKLSSDNSLHTSEGKELNRFDLRDIFSRKIS